VYNLFSTFISNGKSVGDIIQKIKLINTKKGVESKLSFLIRSILKSIAIFVIADLDQTSIIYFIIIIILVFPIKIVTKEYTYYSFLGLGLRSTYIDTENMK
jgi:hypothetical protein